MYDLNIEQTILECCPCHFHSKQTSLYTVYDLNIKQTIFECCPCHFHNTLRQQTDFPILKGHYQGSSIFSSAITSAKWDAQEAPGLHPQRNQGSVITQGKYYLFPYNLYTYGLAVSQHGRAPLSLFHLALRVLACVVASPLW